MGKSRGGKKVKTKKEKPKNPTPNAQTVTEKRLPEQKC